MTKIRWIIFSIIAIGFLSFLFIYNDRTTIKLDNVDINQVQPANEDNGQIGDHVYGKADSKVVLVNYSNYQCSYCAKFHPDFQSLSEDYKDKIAFVFRNIADNHYPNSIAASTAAEAAGLQAKFWPMHDILLSSQDEWSNLGIDQRAEVFLGYAKKLGLNINQFKKDLSSSQISKKLKYDRLLSDKHSIKGTPALILNGVDIDSSNFGDIKKVRGLIDEEIRKSGI